MELAEPFRDDQARSSVGPCLQRDLTSGLRPVSVDAFVDDGAPKVLFDLIRLAHARLLVARSVRLRRYYPYGGTPNEVADLCNARDDLVRARAAEPMGSGDNDREPLLGLPGAAFN